MFVRATTCLIMAVMYRFTHILLMVCLGPWLACAGTGANGQAAPQAPGPAPAPTPVEASSAGSSSPSSRWGEDPQECRRAIKGDSPVARACRQGGVRSAKATMKELVKQGQVAGMRLACDDCHLDGVDFAQLSPDAPERFRSLLVAIGRN
jgi:hypothetical protein